MVLNKKATTILLRMMIGVVCFILGTTLGFTMQQVSSDSQAQLNCSSVTDYQTKTNCTVIDLFTPLIMGVISAIGGFILIR